ncbi:hypothetical protein [Ornithinimicrobium avium]|uniref:hypothetical protein n=1 Tax=Ornithinimicrobium avium TaxID=2283195 RepID=UPI001D18DC24|nr:hypothetical protein [Ornithinimicrobium avium]
MSKSEGAARAAWWGSKDEVRIDHATLVDADVDWLQPVKRLTLWAVKHPDNLLACLPRLEFLDIRGGSGTNVRHIAGCRSLRVLVVNQVRGMSDLGDVAQLSTLELLSLYGLPRVQTLPLSAGMPALTRVELGSMKGLSSIAPILAAPALEELQLVRKVNLSSKDIHAIREHPSLVRFGWFAEDVPDKVWKPVVDRIGKPAPAALTPEKWLDQHPG